MDAPVSSIRAAAAALIALLAVTGAGCLPQPTRLPTVTGPTGTIYVLFQSPYLQDQCSLYVDRQWIATVQVKKYVRLAVAPSPHHISAVPPDPLGFEEHYVEINVQSGSTYYASMINTSSLLDLPLEVFLQWHPPGVVTRLLSSDEGQTLMKTMTLQEQLFPPGTQ